MLQEITDKLHCNINNCLPQSMSKSMSIAWLD